MATLQALIGTLVGALVALVSLWVKAGLDRRQQLQNHFHEYFVERAIDPLLAKLLECEFYYSLAATGSKLPSKWVPDLPAEELSRVQMLFGHNQLTVLFFHLYTAQNAPLASHQAGQYAEIAMRFGRRLGTIRDAATRFRLNSEKAVFAFRDVDEVCKLGADLKKVWDSQ